MKNSIRSILVRRESHQWLEPVVKSWFTTMDRFCEQVDWKRSREVRSKVAAGQWNGVDCPWWYTERANIGLLAAGATRKGMVVLEEFNDEKVYGRAGLKRYNGRIDLMIWKGKRIKGAAFEAKQAWARIEERSDANSWLIRPGVWNYLQRNWTAAQMSAKAVHPDYHRYALLFAPVVMERRDISGHRLAGALDAVASSLGALDRKPGLIAYYAPQRKDRRGNSIHAEWSRHGAGSAMSSHVGIALAVRRV